MYSRLQINDEERTGQTGGWNDCWIVDGSCRVPLIARFVGQTWGPSGADRTQVSPKLAPWTLLSGTLWSAVVEGHFFGFSHNCLSLESNERILFQTKIQITYIERIYLEKSAIYICAMLSMYQRINTVSPRFDLVAIFTDTTGNY